MTPISTIYTCVNYVKKMPGKCQNRKAEMPVVGVYKGESSQTLYARDEGHMSKAKTKKKKGEEGSFIHDHLRDDHGIVRPSPELMEWPLEGRWSRGTGIH